MHGIIYLHFPTNGDWKEQKYAYSNNIITSLAALLATTQFWGVVTVVN